MENQSKQTLKINNNKKSRKRKEKNYVQLGDPKANLLTVVGIYADEYSILWLVENVFSLKNETFN